MRRLRWLGWSLLVAPGILFTLWCLAAVLFTSRGTDAKEMRALLACKELEVAAEAYRNHTANPDHQPPMSVGDVIHPPWGGPSLYRHGDEEPRDPWGNPFRPSPDPAGE
jgi:hypothetical protein